MVFVKFILLYVLGVILSYVSTVLYYYRKIPHTNKSIRLKVSTEKTIDETISGSVLFLSWIYFTVFIITVVLTRILKHLIDKLLKLLLNA